MKLVSISTTMNSARWRNNNNKYNHNKYNNNNNNNSNNNNNNNNKIYAWDNTIVIRWLIITWTMKRTTMLICKVT